MKVSHYTKLDLFPAMRESLMRGDPMKKRPVFGTHLPEQAAFAFLEPLPPEWTQNRYFPQLWEHARQRFGTLLLELDIDPDRAYVLNYAPVYNHYYAPDFDEESGHCLQSAHPRQIADAYAGSKKSIQEYTSGSVRYLMPEVVIPDDVHWSDVSIAGHQPRILEDLAMVTGASRADYIRCLQTIPELAALWSTLKE